jgi:hypothetical protein
MIQMTVYDRMRATCHVIASANTRVMYVSSSPLASFLSFSSQDFMLELKMYVPGPHGPKAAGHNSRLEFRGRALACCIALRCWGEICETNAGR